MIFRFGVPVLMFQNACLVLSDQHLKTTLVAGVFEFSVALLERARHPAHLAALPERANPDEELSEIRSDIWTLDVETDLTLRSIGWRLRRRPIQTGDHKMIIIPQQKLSVQLAILNLHEPDASGAGRASSSFASCRFTGPEDFK